MIDVAAVFFQGKSRDRRVEKGGGDADCVAAECCSTIGSEVCKILLNQYEAHSLIASRKRSNKLRTDRDIVFGALANVVCISHQAKTTALGDNSAAAIPWNLVAKIYNQFKQCFVEFKVQPTTEVSRKKSDSNAKVREREPLNDGFSPQMFDCGVVSRGRVNGSCAILFLSVIVTVGSWPTRDQQSAVLVHELHVRLHTREDGIRQGRAGRRAAQTLGLHIAEPRYRLLGSETLEHLHRGLRQW